MKKHLSIILLTVCTLGSLNADWFSEQWKSVEKPIRNVLISPIGDVAPNATPQIRNLAQQVQKISKQIAEAQRQKNIQQTEKLKQRKKRVETLLIKLGYRKPVAKQRRSTFRGSR